MPVSLRGKLTAYAFGHLRLVTSLTMVGFGVVGLGSAVSASPPSNPGAGVGTPLPSGWEVCILQGVGAPVTPDDVANLDVWQAAEGGSTNNTAAYNPFNTQQVTDPTGAPLPATTSPDGFPAFPTLAAGCAATVATLLKPEMAPIVTALKSGDVAPPGIFLSDVDQTPWCAPSADGIPCYASKVLAGELVGVLLNGSAGPLSNVLTSYSDTSPDLSAYEKAASVTAADQKLVAATTPQLAVTENGVSVAEEGLSTAAEGLRQLAIDDFTTDRMLSSDPTVALVSPPDEQSTVAHYYEKVAATLLIDRYDQAQATVKTAISQRQAAATSVAQVTSAFDAAGAVENLALSRLEADVKSIEVARACAAPPVITPAAIPAGGPATPGQLWVALQDCLVATPPAGPPASAQVGS
jgi:hypothetical protein